MNLPLIFLHIPLHSRARNPPTQNNEENNADNGKEDGICLPLHTFNQ